MTLLPKKNERRASPGEPLVWFTGMGLTLGLLMVIGLLGVILVNGLEVFWPDRVARVQLHEGKTTPAGASFFATVVREREKVAAQERGRREYLLFAGNKNFLGTAYFYADAEVVESREYPANLLRIERAEFGDALLEPVSLVMRDGKTIAATDAGFHDALAGILAESKSIRKKLDAIERGAVGGLNRKIQAVRLQMLKTEEALSLVSNPAETSRWEAEKQRLLAEMAELEATFEKLSGGAVTLREQLGRGSFAGKLGDGREVRIAGGDILGYYFPNQLGFGGKVGVFLEHIWKFLSEDPREANTEGGVFPAIFGTFCMTVLMSALVTPFGVIAAIYLREYAKQGALVRWVRICVNNLAGVPSIVFGVFGFGFFVYIVGGTVDALFFSDSVKYSNTPVFGTGGVLWASLTLALMTLPVVIVATEEALAAVPRGAREASLACGASKWQTIRRIVLPAAAPGILTGMILAMARGAGEVAPLMMVGVVKLAPTLPFDGTFPFVHLDRKFMHLGFHIYDLGFQSPDSDAARPMVFATTLLLIALVLVLNAGAIRIRNQLRRKYQTGAF